MSSTFNLENREHLLMNLSQFHAEFHFSALLSAWKNPSTSTTSGTWRSQFLQIPLPALWHVSDARCCTQSETPRPTQEVSALSASTAITASSPTRAPQPPERWDEHLWRVLTCLVTFPNLIQVQLFDAFNLQAKMMIPAHDSRYLQPSNLLN